MNTTAGRVTLLLGAIASAKLLAPLPTGAAPPPALFEEVPAAQSGIAWTHENAMSAEHYLPESLGPGVAFFDYDQDGWQDIFLVNSGEADFYKPKAKPRHALYRNQRDGTFRDVTQKAGLAGGTSFGMGVAAGDYNNDGFPDLYVTAYGRSSLYRNNRNGTFTDVAAESGTLADRWTTSAAWFDYDGDGLLDLFVCGFVEYRRETQKLCIDARGGRPGYCIPRMFKPSPSLLFRNQGDGTFRDASAETHVARRLGKALGVVASDVNNDGRMDLFVANDTVENFLLLNRGGKIFEDVGYGAMVALSPEGMARSGMGVDSADVDGDGWQDLFVSNIDREMYSLYRNTGHGLFDDLAFAGEIGRATYNMSGWGLRFLDLDNDGAMDLFLANGHPDDYVAERSPRVRYREPLLLFRQMNKTLRNVSAQGGPAFQKELSGRGLAAGDYDNDGRIDVLIGVNGGAPLLLRNTVMPEHHWLGIKLRGVNANRDGVGARITWRAGGVTRSRLKVGGGSFLSAQDAREILGLGGSAGLDWIEVRWPAPSTRVERFHPAAANRYITLTEGQGR